MSARRVKITWRKLGERNPCTCHGVQLTPIEMEMLQLVSESHTVKDIAGIVGLSYKGTEYHMANLQRKLNTYGSARLTMSAIRNRLITP